MAGIGHIRMLPWLRRASALACGGAARRRKAGWSGQLGTRSMVLGILGVSSALWFQPGCVYGQAARPDRVSEEQLMARDCDLAPGQIVAAVDEQLTRTVPDGSLWVKAGSQLYQILTGCKTDPVALLAASGESRYFNLKRSTDRDPKYFYSFTFSKRDELDEFSIRFAVCKQNIREGSLRCDKNQIMKVTSILDVHRVP